MRASPRASTPPRNRHRTSRVRRSYSTALTVMRSRPPGRRFWAFPAVATMVGVAGIGRRWLSDDIASPGVRRATLSRHRSNRKSMGLGRSARPGMAWGGGSGARSRGSDALRWSGGSIDPRGRSARRPFGPIGGLACPIAVPPMACVDRFCPTGKIGRFRWSHSRRIP